MHVGSAQNAVDAVNAGADVLAHGIYRSALSDADAKTIAKKNVPVIYTLAGFVNVLRIADGEYAANSLDSMLLPHEILEGVSLEAGKKINETEVMKDFVRDVRANAGFWKKNFELLRKNGVKILVGTDSALPGTYPGSTYLPGNAGVTRIWDDSKGDCSGGDFRKCFDCGREAGFWGCEGGESGRFADCGGQSL